MDAKRELAKDVASFANAAGGYICVGLATKRSTLRPGEEVESVRPIRRELFDDDQYLKIISEWLHPTPKDIEIAWVQWGDDPEKGVAIITVPPQNERAKPFLITRTIGDSKSTEVLLGYVERRVDTTEVLSVEELHHALRTGFNLERELLGRLDVLQSTIERHFSVAADAQTNEERNEHFRDRIARTLAAGTSGEPRQP